MLSWRKSVLNIHWKDWCWSWNSNTLTTCCRQLTPWKILWYWEKLKAWGKGMVEDEMVGWHHQLGGHEFEQASGVGNEQGSLVCCSPWGRKSWTRLSNWTELTVATSKNDITNVYKASLKQFSIWKSPKQKQYPMDWFFPCWAFNWITTEFYLRIQMQ